MGRWDLEAAWSKRIPIATPAQKVVTVLVVLPSPVWPGTHKLKRDDESQTVIRHLPINLDEHAAATCMFHRMVLLYGGKEIPGASLNWSGLAECGRVICL